MNEEPQNHLTLWKGTDAPPQPVPENNLPFPENNLPFPENNLLPCPENKIATSGFLQVVPPEPPQPVPEEFPLTVDCGVVPWSKIPIAEISPLVWFRYESDNFETRSFTVCDGNGRKLFWTAEEEIAKFFVTAANLYVQAGMQTQTQV